MQGNEDTKDDFIFYTFMEVQEKSWE